jgi:hypothetical protein
MLVVLESLLCHTQFSFYAVAFVKCFVFLHHLPTESFNAALQLRDVVSQWFVHFAFRREIAKCRPLFPSAPFCREG